MKKKKRKHSDGHSLMSSGSCALIKALAKDRKKHLNNHKTWNSVTYWSEVLLEEEVLLDFWP